MLRKPFVIGRHMYSNGVRVSYVDRLNRDGYLTNSLWIDTTGDVHLGEGQAMFRGQCMSCHTQDGYRSMTRLLGRDRQAIGSLLAILYNHALDSPYRAFMPPLVGTPGEIDSLGDYLLTISHPEPSQSLAAVQPAAVARTTK
jgi:cytochrome bd ubiquinol oxidase subunit I